jgi:hypothetical protein
MIETEKTVAVASYFATVFTAALFMALVGRYSLHLYGSSGSRVGVLGNFRGLEACM